MTDTTTDQTTDNAQANKASQADQQADERIEVNEAELPEAQPGTSGEGSGQLDILLDTTMTVSAVLGETTMPVSELLQLGNGSVVALDRQLGQPVDLYLRGIRFATGQVVVIDDKMGIRIKEVLSGQN